MQIQHRSQEELAFVGGDLGDVTATTSRFGAAAVKVAMQQVGELRR